jgi:hypothetical protein
MIAHPYLRALWSMPTVPLTAGTINSETGNHQRACDDVMIANQPHTVGVISFKVKWRSSMLNRVHPFHGLVERSFLCKS